jgi:integrase
VTRSSRIVEIRNSIQLHGVPKAKLGKARSLIITSLGTGRVTDQSVSQFQRWRKAAGLDSAGPYLRAEALEYLIEFAETHGESAVTAEKQALSRFFSWKLPHIPSLIETVREGRATRWEEVVKIASRQRYWNSLATLAAYDGGLRAVELLTLRHAHEIETSSHRSWPSELFLGRTDVVPMVVTGKGGLRRPAALASELVELLEKLRRDAPTPIMDRGVIYHSYFHIGGGQAFSQSFSDASQRVLGLSTGAHGLRHAYAQRRVRELMTLGLTFMDAIKLVSIELGHWRILYDYYMPR